MPDMQSHTPLQSLIRLAAAGARQTALGDFSADWSALLSLAADQHLLPLVACALLHGEPAGCPSGVREQCLEALRASAAVNAIRMRRTLQLVGEMEAAGFRVCVLKGASVARLYAYPESRSSVDTDLLIDAEQERAVYAFLREKGFTVKGRRSTANDGACEHAKYGKIEIHTSLYPELTETAWAGLAEPQAWQQEPLLRVTLMDGSFDTLGHTDQLIFLTLHMIKHFTESGLSIRMMLDVALHFAAFHQEIDTARFWRVLQGMKCGVCVSQILWIMIRFGGFPEESFPGIGEAQPDRMDDILRDIEAGGYMGAREMTARHEGGMEYYRRMLMHQRSPAQYRRYMLGWKIRSASRNMFPSYQRLKHMYPCVARLPVIAPALWIFQAVRYPAVKICSGVLRRDIRRDRSAMTPESQQRVQLFDKLGML